MMAQVSHGAEQKLKLSQTHQQNCTSPTIAGADAVRSLATDWWLLYGD